MYKIGIIGLGLMGGSLAKAFSKLEDVEKVIACSRNMESLEKAKEEGYVQDITNSVDDKFTDLDFVFICTPVNTIFDYAKKLEGLVKKDCIVTDIGSTKKHIVEQIKELDINFIGAHPMIGSEKAGYDFSTEDLYQNTFYLLTTTDKTKKDDIEKFKGLIAQIGAIPLEISKDKHDFAVATISHVPHIVASGLVNLVKDLDDDEEKMKTIAAGGFKDITRIASANTYMWQNICLENKEQIVKVLEEFEKIIKEFKDNINNADKVYEYFDSAKTYRDSFSDIKKIK